MGVLCGASLFALVAMSPAVAGGLPSGGQVVAGQANIGTAAPGKMVIDQTGSHAIINWQDFSIAAGNSVKINNGTGATLNRVTGGNLSQIDGVLKATGSAYLINPQGVVVGPGGKIVTGGSFVASTRDVDNDAFLRGDNLHANGTSNGAVVNQGKIVSRYGDTILIGKSVSNSGTIKAPKGTAALAAGDDVVLRPMGGDARISVSAGKGDVTNTGTIAAAQAELNAANGNVYAVAGNQGGITVTGTKTVGGRIWLSGGDTTEISGAVTATNKDGSGGTIIATAQNVTVNADAAISASGTTGGTVLLGGDEAGGSDAARKHVSAPVANAKVTTVARGAKISADGNAGAGGTVVVWSDEFTAFDALISARGTGQGGGGFAEVSSHGVLSYTGLVDLTSANGLTGTLLLDPYAVTIVSGTGGTISSNKFTPTAASNLGATTLTNALANASVTVNIGTTGSGTGSITLNSGVSLTWTAASTLTLDASAKSAAPIALGGAITATNGGLNIKAGSGAAVTDTAAINVQNFTLTSGNWSQSAASLPSFSAANFVIAGGTFLRVVGGDGSGTPYQIADIYGLQGMNGFQSSNFSLANDIDASSTATWNAGAGFVPLILNSGLIFDGQNHTINGLTISQTSWSLGLFNYNYGTIQNLTLSGGSVTDGGGIGAGALVGANSGTIKNVHSSVTVSGADGSDNANYLQQAGGLVGSNSGTISNSSASGNVSGYNQIGGLVGNNYGQIINSSATGTVTPGAVGFTAADAGGLVGRNEGGTIDGGVASGNVVGQLTGGYGVVGGLVGTNIGTIKNSHASGNVTAGGSAGGLVGINGGYANGTPATGSIDNSYYELGTVKGYDDTGGLVGANGDYFSAYSGVITNSYAATTATVIGTRDSGGLVGSNYNTGSISGSHSGATVAPIVGGSGDQIYETGGLVGRSGGIITDSYATGTVTTGNASYYTGGLAGELGGTASNVYATGDVIADNYVGGLAGVVDGNVTTAHATGAITTYDGLAGGFAGIVNGTITNSYATGNVTATDASLTSSGFSAGTLGGFAGSNGGTISSSYASGNVTGGDGSDSANYGTTIGGFVASNGGTLSLVHTTGVVTGFSSVGGLVGSNGSGSITDSYATGAVNAAGSYVGGLIGDFTGGTMARVYASGAVTDTGSYAVGNPYYVGGLIGLMSGGTLSQSYATGTVTATDMSAIGGLIGGMTSPPPWGASGPAPTVTDTYATGTVNGAFFVGGLVGEMEVGSLANSYAANTVNSLDGPGALVGVNAFYGTGGTIVNSYYDTTQGLPGLSYDAGPSTSVTGLTTAQMHDSSNFTGFDFTNTWSPADATYLPELYGVSYVIKAKATGGTVQYGDAISGAINFIGLQNGDLSSSIAGLSIVGANQGDDVGSYAITAAGASLTSSSGSAYRFVYENGTINITQRQLTLGLIGSVTKTYDRTVDAALTAANYGTLGNIYNNDDVSVASYLTSGAFSDWNVGDNKTVTVSGLSLTGAKASNYTLGTGATGNIGFINPLQVSLGLTGTVEKTYDRSTTATVAAGNYTVLGNIISGDTVTLDTSGASATYGDYNAGGTKAVTVTGPALGGANAGNYSIAANISGNVGLIDPKTLTTTMKSTVISKTYDGLDTATVSSSNFNSLSGIVSGDSGAVALSLTLASAHYSDANANTGKAVTVSGLALSGAASGNYVLGSSTLSVNAGTINKKALTTLTGTVEKTYDKITTATLTAANYGALVGVVGTDDVSLVSMPTSGTYNSATGGSGKTVTVTGLSLTGAQAGNYTVTNTANIGLIDPAQLVYTATAASKTYGGATPSFSGTVTGLVSGDTLTTIISGTATWTVATAGNSTSSNAGSYSITGGGLTVKAASTANYTLVQAAGNATAFTINPATLTYTANAASKTYGSANPGFSGTITGFLLSQTQATATTGTLTFSSQADGTSAKGSYAITGSGLTANNGNYVFVQAAANATRFTINPAALTITANSISKAYGDTVTFAGTEFQTSGLKNSDGVTSVTLSSSGAANTASVNGSPYAITASNAAGSGLSNYTISYAAGGLTVTPVTLTYTSNAATRLYGATEPSFSGNVSGFVLGQTQATATTGTLAFSTTATQSSNIGNYAINGGGLTANSGNYIFAQAAANATQLAITPATLTYVADNVSKTYGAVNPTLTGTVTGFVLGQNQATATTSTLGFAPTLTVTQSSNAGSYGVTGSGLTANNGNYIFAQAVDNATAFAINPATLTYTADPANKIYGDANPALTGTITGFVLGQTQLTETTGTLGFSSLADQTSAKGNYAITGSGLVSNTGNYAFAQAVGNVTALTINPATLTITASSNSKTYGGMLSFAGTEFSTSGLVNGDAVSSVSLSSTGAAAAATVAGSPYAITASNAVGTGLSNYTIGYVDGTLTVSPATLTVTASSISKTYGDTLSFAGTEFSTSGLVNGDAISSVSLSSAGAAATAMVSGSPYAIAASNAVGTGLSNYTIGYVAGDLTVNPATLTITADNTSKTYGNALTFAGTEFSTGGLVNGDSVSSVSLSSTGAAATAQVSGSPYAITAANAAGTGLSNYTIDYVAGGLTVNSATLTITANSAIKTYGNTLTFAGSEFSASGLVNGDNVSTVSLSSTGAAATAVVPGSPYAITASNAVGTGLSNYTIGYVAGGLTINPAALTVTANSGQSKVYGDSDTTLGYGITAGHLVGTDTLTGTLARAAGESAGNYAITQGSLVASANYALNFTPGTAFTITPMALTVAAVSGQSKVYGSADPVLAYQIAGGHLVGADTLSGALSRAAGETVGSYAITQGTLAVSSNYTLAFTPGSLAITPAALAITAGNTSKTYGDAASLSAAGFTVSGLVRGDSVTGVNLTSSGAGVTAGVGSYAIIASGAAGSGLSNYTIAYAPGSLTVGARPLVITIANASKVYGAANSGLTAGAPGLVNGDTLAGAPVTAASQSSHVGSYAIIPGTLSVSANYIPTFVNGVLVITRAGLTVSANNITAGSVAQASPTASFSGLVNGDTSAVVTGLQFALLPVTGVTYAVLPFGASAQDYSIAYTQGQLTIIADQPSQIALAIPPQTGNASGTLTINGQTLTFTNVATSAIGDSGAVTLFQVGVPGQLGGFANFVISDYSNATSENDRLAQE